MSGGKGFHPDRLRQLLRRYGHVGLRRTMASVAAKGVVGATERVLKTRLAPSYRELVTLSPPAMTATDFITSLGLQRPTQQDLRKWNEEYEAVDASLMSRYASVGLVCPPQWAVGTESARALYLLTRWLRPRVFVETGVANGHSSFVLLSAMEANAAGSLVSLDVVPDAGCLVTEQLSSRWQLLVLDPADPIAAAAEGLAGVDEVDIFFHDADHSYVGQLADYELADAVLARGRLGLMLSDDVDESFAFIEHVRRRGLRPSLLVDGPKVMGACWSKQQAVADASTQASRPA